MSIRIKKASENSIYSLKKYITNITNELITEYESNQKNKIQNIKKQIIKETISYFDEKYKLNDEDLDQSFNDIMKRCDDIEYQDPTVSCAKFVIENDHTVKKKHAEPSHKSHIFKIVKKEKEKETKKAVTPYYLFQSELRETLKQQGKTVIEIRDIIKTKWKDIQENKEEYEKLKIRTESMETKPEKTKRINIDAKELKTWFIAKSRKKYIKNFPDASDTKINMGVRKKWNQIKQSPEKYNKYANMMKQHEKPKKQVHFNDIVIKHDHEYGHIDMVFESDSDDDW